MHCFSSLSQCQLWVNTVWKKNEEGRWFRTELIIMEQRQCCSVAAVGLRENRVAGSPREEGYHPAGERGWNLFRWSRHEACIRDAITEILQGQGQVCSGSASLFKLGEAEAWVKVPRRKEGLSFLESKGGFLWGRDGRSGASRPQQQ